MHPRRRQRPQENLGERWKLHNALTLFAMGASLQSYKLGKNLKEPLVLVFIKTVIHPLMVWLIATYVFSLPRLWTMDGVTLAALPAGVTPYLFAQRHQACVETVASTIFISILFSVVSLSLVLFLFGTCGEGGSGVPGDQGQRPVRLHS